MSVSEEESNRIYEMLKLKNPVLLEGKKVLENIEAIEKRLAFVKRNVSNEMYLNEFEYDRYAEEDMKSIRVLIDKIAGQINTLNF